MKKFIFILSLVVTLISCSKEETNDNYIQNVEASSQSLDKYLFPTTAEGIKGATINISNSSKAVGLPNNFTVTLDNQDYVVPFTPSDFYQIINLQHSDKGHNGYYFRSTNEGEVDGLGYLNPYGNDEVEWNVIGEEIHYLIPFCVGSPIAKHYAYFSYSHDRSLNSSAGELSEGMILAEDDPIVAFIKIQREDIMANHNSGEGAVIRIGLEAIRDFGFDPTYDFPITIDDETCASQIISLSNVMEAAMAAGLTGDPLPITLPVNDYPGEYIYQWLPILRHTRGGTTEAYWRRNSNDVLTGVRIKLGPDGPGRVDVYIEDGSQDELLQQLLMFVRLYNNQIEGLTYNEDLTYRFVKGNSRELQMLALGVNIFDIGSASVPPFFAAESNGFTKVHEGNSNQSVIDLTALGSINSTTFNTAPTNSLSFTDSDAAAGDWYVFKNGTKHTFVKVTGVDGSGVVSANGFRGDSFEATKYYHWKIQDPTGFGIVKVDIPNLDEYYKGYYYLKDENWDNSTHFDGVNNSGFSNTAPQYYDHVELDAASGIVNSRSYRFAPRNSSGGGGSRASRIFYDYTVVIMRSSQHPRGFGVYAHYGANAYRALWYSHDLVHLWEHGFNNDFEGKVTQYYKLESPRFLR